MSNAAPVTTEKHPVSSSIARNVLIGVAYALAGGLGLMIAAPPGYATLIWPASGIAIGGLILFGAQIWPGVFLGSFILNFLIGGGVGTGSPVSAALVAALIAFGSTLQAFLAARLATARFGVPLRFETARELALFACIIGPAVCWLAPTIGVSTLYLFGIVSLDAVAGNWLTWWIGDSAGALVFVPIVLFGPWRPWGIHWDGQLLAGFTGATLLATTVPLGVTFYAWKITSEIAFQQNRTAFEALAEESERALIHRMENYRLALDGGAGLFTASEMVTLEEWRNYVQEIDLEDSLQGINGIGFVEPVRRGELDGFKERLGRIGVGDLSIHPETGADELFVIVFIEPLGPNLNAKGLDIAFESNRYNAAAYARDTGRATITQRILLVQDDTASPGFLLLRPLYNGDVPLDSIEQRRAAFRGWVYAPFVGNRFLAQLTNSQGESLNISVYDGGTEAPETLIYSSAGTDPPGAATYRVTRTLPIEEREWTVVWESTPAFETAVRSKEPFIILISGVALSLLIGALLLSFARREDAINSLVEQKTRAIRARERENRSIVDTAVVGILLADEDGSILSANAATLQIFGLTGDAVAGKPLGSLIGIVDPAMLASLACAPPEENAAISRTATAAGPNGATLHIDLNINSWRTENGALRFTVIIRDITAEKMASDSLEATERRWHRALSGAEIGVYDIDLPSGKSIVSDTWKALLGFAPGDEIDPQREFLSRIHSEDLPKLLQADADLLAGRAERSVSEFRIRTANGKFVWLRSDGFIAERDADGAPLRMVGTQMDVTSLRRATAALKANEKRFRSAIENAPIGTALLEPGKGRIVLANAALASFLQIDLAALAGQDLCELRTPGGDGDRAALREWLADAAAPPNYRGEHVFERTDGTKAWGLLNASRAPVQEDAAPYLIVQILDVTERREIDRLKSEFIATVSHELRTPLTSIRGSLGLMSGTMAKDLPEKVQNLLQIASRNCDRLVTLVNEILDLEKLASNRHTFHMEDHDLAELLRVAVEANQAYADEFGVRLGQASVPQDILVSVDAARFQQIMANLLSNAAKFSPRDGTVDVTVVRAGDQVRVSVRDHGPGIPNEFRARIFERFSQADNASSRGNGGTGLGLHISKQIAEMMQGVLGFDSVPGEGATFWLELPVKP